MRTVWSVALGGLLLAAAATSARAEDDPARGEVEHDQKMDTWAPEDPRDPAMSPTMEPAPPPPPPAAPVTREIYSERVREPVIVEPTVIKSDSFRDRWGLAVSAGGGVNDFTGDAMRDITGTGGAWDARLAIGTKQVIGFEAAYIGTAQSIDAIGLEDDALLVSNGAEGLVRVNLLPGRFQPYAFGGVAWKRYDLTRTETNTSDVIDQDNVFELPLGVGANARYAGMLFDIRAAYRIATGEDLVPERDLDDVRPTPGESFSTLDNFNVSAHVGVEF